MPAHFSSYGPFAFSDFSRPLRALDFKDLWARTPDGLSEAIGVYVLISGAGKQSIPVYVGQSQASFRDRLKYTHHAFLLAFEHHSTDDLSLHLFPRVTTGKNKFVRKPDGVSLKSINSLEVLMMRDCMTLNQKLLNKREKTFFEGLSVPGYLDSANSKLTPDARRLRKLFSGKRQ